jgi:hypothetical protein
MISGGVIVFMGIVQPVRARKMDVKMMMMILALSCKKDDTDNTQQQKKELLINLQ